MEYERVYKDDIKKIERILGIDRRDYLNSGFFMRMDRGQKTTLHYETDNGVKEVVYKHKMIERRDGVVYAIGFFKNENEAWEIKEDAIYEERLSMIMSDNGEKIFIER
jgi:putative salt-induced outer membrane protein YdiY